MLILFHKLLTSNSCLFPKEIALALPKARFDEGAETIKARTEKLELSDPAKVVVHYHSVEFTGLKPDTLYAYRVGSENRKSEWIQFRTAKAEPEPFSFLYFGDAQNSVLSFWSRIIRAAYKKAPHAAFSIHAGDLVDSAHKDREWAEWFKAGGWIHSSVPSIPVSGNHEYSGLKIDGKDKGNQLSIQWRSQFALPAADVPESLAETVYTLDYQGVRIIALNSNREIEAQAKWLETVLAKNPCKWTIVTMHHPMFSSVAVWFFQGLAGIRQRPWSVAFSHLWLRPRPPCGTREPRHARLAALSGRRARGPRVLRPDAGRPSARSRRLSARHRAQFQRARGANTHT